MKNVVAGTQHPGRGTVWVRREGIEFLKNVAIVRGDKTLDETMMVMLDHYRSCSHGLATDLKDAQKRLESLRQVQLVEIPPK